MASREQFPTAKVFLPSTGNLPGLREAASRCQGCDLYKRATQTVFGEGTKKAAIMLIGEQPGDKEDIAGRPFVGPAGRLLNEALEDAGIDRADVYVTNAVKHFSWETDERGKRRLHKKPRYSEIQACRPWLDAEIAAVRPQVVICMGATAAQVLLGKTFSVTRQRGTFVPSAPAPFVMATGHPSSILRAPDERARHEQMQAFVRDLTVAAEKVRKLRSAA
jgi:uracil-DNA glycosylase